MYVHYNLKLCIGFFSRGFVALHLLVSEVKLLISESFFIGVP